METVSIRYERRKLAKREVVAMRIRRLARAVLPLAAGTDDVVRCEPLSWTTTFCADDLDSILFALLEQRSERVDRERRVAGRRFREGSTT